MTKNISFFLLVLFSLSALNSREEDKHKRCERKRSWTEVIVKTAVVGFLLTHALPVVSKIFSNKEVCLASSESFADALLCFSSKPADGSDLPQQMRQAPPLVEAFSNAGVEALKEAYAQFKPKCKSEFFVITGALAIFKGVTAVIFKPIF